MGYLFLFLTILSESSAICFMKLANGFQNKVYLIVGALFYIAGFLLLTQALKHLPMGWANAIWAGASTVVVVVLGLIFFDETVSLKQGVFIGLIVIGLVGLQIVKEA
jgi:small multidrug resistance pump